MENQSQCFFVKLGLGFAYLTLLSSCKSDAPPSGSGSSSTTTVPTSTVTPTATATPTPSPSASPSASPSPSACFAQPSGLVSWWDGDTVTSTLLKDITGTNHGTFNGQAAQVTSGGKVGNACTLDGDADFVSVPHSASLNLTTALSVVAWVNSTKNSQSEIMQTVMSKWQSSTSFSTFNAYDAGTTNSLNTKGYVGAVFDGRYVYFVPEIDNTFANHGRVLRYDSHGTFSSSGNWNAFDTTSLLGGASFNGAVFDGRYIYFIPNFDGKTMRYDTQADFNSLASYTVFDAGSIGSNTKGYFGGVFDGRYVYFVPYTNAIDFHARVLRYDTQASFTATGSWATFNAGAVNSLSNAGYNGGTFDGRYVYFAPYGLPYNGNVLQYDTQAGFTAGGSWNAYDASGTSGLVAKGYTGAVFDGRYVYFIPNSNGTGRHGVVLRYDSQGGFSTSSSWVAFDVSAIGTNTKGYNGGVFDGRFLYLVPFNDGTSDQAKVLRYDTLATFNSSGSWSSVDASSTDSITTKGYSGAAFDGRHIYFVPNGVAGRHGKVLRYDTSSDGAFSLKYTQQGHQGGFGGSDPGLEFLINTTTGPLSVAMYSNLSTGYHLVVGTYDGTTLKLYVDGALVNSRAKIGTLVTNTTPLIIGGVQSGKGYFNGIIDEAQLYNRALSASEITSIFSAGSAGVCK